MADLARSREGLEFSAVYEEWFDHVERWLRAQGAPDSEVEDLTQEVFLVVRRKLEAFDGRNLPGWLYRIAANTWSDQRRRTWFRNLFSRPREVELDGFVLDADGPAELLERKEERAELHRLLARMSEKRRAAFVLFEVEGYSGEEIAGLLDVPLATVWTRLHHARKDFLALVGELQREERRQ